MTTKIETMKGGPSFNYMKASEQWMSRPADQRFTTLEELQAAVDSRRSRSFVRDVNLDRLTAVPVSERGIQLQTPDRTANPTNWAFGQLCASVGAPRGYLQSLPAELACRNLNHGLAAAAADPNKRDQNRLLLANQPDDPTLPLSAPLPHPALQAVTSTSYGRIWDADVVRMVRQIQADHPEFHNPLAYGRDGTPEPSGLYASDRDCFLFLIDGGSYLEAGTRNGKPDTLNRGFIVWNSEVGRCTYGTELFLFRGLCGNHILWGCQDLTRLTIRHSKGGPGRFEDEALPAILDHVHSSAAQEESIIRAAQSYLLPKEDKDLVALVAPFSLTRSELRTAIDYAQREEGDCGNLWQLLNGFTASARDLAHVDSRTDLERRSSKLMSLAEKAAKSPPSTVLIDGIRDGIN